MAGDSNYPLTALLLPMTGSNNSTTFTDTSIVPKTVTPVGQSKIVTTQVDAFGASTGVGYFDGSGDYLTLPYSSDIDLIGKEFTIEGWFRSTNVKTGMRIFSTGGGAVGWNATTGIHLLLQCTPTALSCHISNNTSSPPGGAISATISANQYYYFSLSVIGNSMYVGVDGTVAYVDITGYARPSTNPTAAICTIPGEAGGLTYAYAGYISQFRLLVGSGAAIRTSNFTPPTTPFLTYAGQLSGNYSKGVSTISSWRAKASKCNTGALVRTDIITGTTYTLDIPTIEPHEVTISAAIDYAWSANKVATLGDFVVAVNPDTTQFQFEVTTAGTFDGTEPTWNTTVGGTTTSGTATLTCRGALKDPVTIGPKIPS